MEDNLKEQEICVKCGLCCDGTLFSNATVIPGEKGTMPPYMEENYLKVGEKESFLLPCLYFDTKCTIYDKKRPHVCSSFRCKLLVNFSDAKISQIKADEIIQNAKKIREGIFKEYWVLFPGSDKLSFKQMVTDLAQKSMQEDLDNGLKIQCQKLLAKCNSFDILLIRHFKPDNEFDQMIVK
jgi:hypothetical protein